MHYLVQTHRAPQAPRWKTENETPTGAKGHGWYITVQKWVYFGTGWSGLFMFQRSNTDLSYHRLEAAFQITGFKGSLHRRYPCLEAAQLAWDRACKAGCVGPRKEWGVARARELVPGQQPVLFPEEIPGHSQLCALPKMWYTVVKGAYPGVYFGR